MRFYLDLCDGYLVLVNKEGEQVSNITEITFTQKVDGSFDTATIKFHWSRLFGVDGNYGLTYKGELIRGLVKANIDLAGIGDDDMCEMTLEINWHFPNSRPSLSVMDGDTMDNFVEYVKERQGT